MRALGYLRVSTEEQGQSHLGLEAQEARIREEVHRRGWELIALIEDSGYTAANLNRPGITRALEELAAHRAEVLVVASQDRLSRSMLDWATLAVRREREGWEFVACDLGGIDASTPEGELTANVRMSVAQWERRKIAARTKEALAALKARGARLGRPVVLPPEVRRRIVRLRARGWSLPRIADALTAEGVPTARGGPRWYPSTVAGVLKSVTLDGAAKAARREAVA